MGKADDRLSLLFSIVHCIGQPADLLGEIADTHYCDLLNGGSACAYRVWATGRKKSANLKA